MLHVDERLLRAIGVHGEASYPAECCGALLGREEGGRRAVLELLMLENGRQDSPQNRFAVSAADVRRAEQTAGAKELEVLGWYHSHPDHPALPSEFDREHAWPWYSYVIVSVQRGEARRLSSWRLLDDRSRFRVEEIEIRAQAGAEK